MLLNLKTTSAYEDPGPLLGGKGKDQEITNRQFPGLANTSQSRDSLLTNSDPIS
jgi:hypothetical protein